MSGLTYEKPVRPPGLRGREIGEYYRDLARKKKNGEKKKGEKKNKIHLGPSVSAPHDVLSNVKQYLRNHVLDSEDKKLESEFESHFLHLLNVNFEEFIRQSKRPLPEMPENLENLDNRLKTEMLCKESTTEFRKRCEQRNNLPAMMNQVKILKAVRENQVVLIVGSTGCGKSTQVPQILLDDYIYENRGTQCRIVCTQPRRVSTIALADRVAFERCESLGSSVGYQIRLESKMPRDCGSILYCTTGILLQKLQYDPLMLGISTLILDEIHERSVEGDLLMALIKKILPYRRDLKLILMSATINEEDFCTYFNNCYTLRIEGTLFPVQTEYLEDILQETGFNKFETYSQGGGGGPHWKYGRKARMRKREAEKKLEYKNMIEPFIRHIRDRYEPHVIQSLRCSDSEGCENLAFLEHLILYICEHKPPGAILVFLPGYDKISKLHNMLLKPSFGHRLPNMVVYPLHSMMPTLAQTSIFQRPPKGTRKVILSTILAETSVTIDDVVYVINSGRTKISSYDPETNIQSLQEAWVTKANSQQRKGRAGRVQPGICYNLFTRARERTMQNMPTPEILRSKLENVILSLKLLHISDPYEFLKTLIDVPDLVTIQNGINLLKRIEALDESETITPLGMHLARLPLDPQMGKMVLMGALFRCLDPITTVAAGLSFKTPFYTPLGQEDKVDKIRREMSANTKSDHLLLDNVMINYREACMDRTERDFCYKNYLSISTLQQLETMKGQFTEFLKAACFIESSSCTAKLSNLNSDNVALLRAIIATGLYPNMAYMKRTRQVKNRVHAIHFMSTPEDGRINFHPSSINSGQISFASNYFVYFQKQKSTALYILDATMVFPMALIIFGDCVESGVSPDGQPYISVGKSYYFKCDEATSEVVHSLRYRLSLLLQKKALYPSPIEPDSAEESLIKAIQILLSLDELDDYEDEYSEEDEGE